MNKLAEDLAQVEVVMSGAGALHRVTLSSGMIAYFSGPSISIGALPTLVYFGASGVESLTLRPFSTPIETFITDKVRALSFDLPFHPEGAEKLAAVKSWATEIGEGRDVITPFIDSVEEAIDELANMNLLDKDNLAFGGLSRGGLIAGHLAARFKKSKAFIGFAPVTKLTGSTSFIEVANNPIAKRLNLEHLAESLAKVPTRLYIGNRDLMVGTRNAFELIERISDSAFENGTRSPKAELILSPSIGHKGHGTAPKIFEEGARWAYEMLV